MNDPVQGVVRRRNGDVGTMSGFTDNSSDVQDLVLIILEDEVSNCIEIIPGEIERRSRIYCSDNETIEG